MHIAKDDTRVYCHAPLLTCAKTHQHHVNFPLCRFALRAKPHMRTSSKRNRHLHAHTILTGASDAHARRYQTVVVRKEQLVRSQTFHLPNTRRVRLHRAPTGTSTAATTAAAKKEIIRR